MDPVPGYQFTSWAKGYGDFRPVPDFNTLRVASWLDKTAIVLCDVYARIASTGSASDADRALLAG